MKHPLKILILEDSPTDAEMVQRLIVKAKIDCVFCLAINKESFLQALKDFSPEIILSDNTLPQFSATEALAIVQHQRLDVPFIIVTGTMSEEFAAQSIKLGADDYILKDRMSRLPTAIEAALRNRQLENEKIAAIQKLIESEDHYRTLVERISDGFLSLDNDMNITYINSVAEQMLKKETGTLTGKHLITEFPEGSSSPIIDICRRAINTGINIHQEYFSEQLQKWIFTSTYPSDTGLSIFFRDITELKKLEKELLWQQQKEQLNMTATALAAQERERNAIGFELHDNVNQILVGTSMFLSVLKKKPEKMDEIIPSCIDKIKEAIEENRKISHGLVTPDLNTISLLQQLSRLCESMLESNGILVQIIRKDFDESLLNQNQKLAIYRITQEQCTNILKYADAKSVELSLSSKNKNFQMKISDDGKGMPIDKKAKDGIGLVNIAGRLSILNGAMKIDSEQGKGFSLEFEMPL